MNKHQYRKSAHQKLREWMTTNNITEKCVVHHRDDTEETRKYNAEHYNKWGFNENDEFIEGQYVIFMTLKDHIKYHHTGAQRSEEICKHISESLKGNHTNKQYEALARLHASQVGVDNPMYGKKHSEESRRKMSEHSKGQISPMKGKHHSEQSKNALRDAQHAYHEKMHKLFEAYKASNGPLNYKCFCKAIKSGDISPDNFNYFE